MNDKNGLGKAYRIIRNINCCLCFFSAFFMGIGIIRLVLGNAANPFSICGLLLFLIALWGVYLLEDKSKKIGIAILLIGEALGGLCISADPEDGMITMVIYGGIALLQILSIDWKTFFKSK